MRRFATLLFLLLVSNIVLADKLFDYRGVFSANRKEAAFITNYMLLKKATGVRFELVEPGKGETGRVSITSVSLTSNPKIVFKNPDGISQLNLPESGIYEVKIEPSESGGGEIPFVLKVYKEERVASSTKIQNEFPILIEPVTVPKKLISDINQASLKLGEPKEKKQEIGEDKIERTSIISSSTPEVMNATQTIIPEKKEVKPEFKILSPAPNSFLNPLNGFEVSFTAISSATPDFEKIFVVTQFQRNGKRSRVKGSYFSDKEGSFKFLPNEIVPGIIYHAAILDIQTGSRLEEGKFESLPELKCEINPEQNLTTINIYWEQNPEFLPNPIGQLIRMNNSTLRLFEEENEVLKLSMDKNLPPFGVIGQIKYKAGPYSLKLEVPGFKPDLKVEIDATVDGHKDPVSILRKSLKIASINATDSREMNEDFSDVPALPAISDNTKKGFIGKALETMGDAITIRLEKRLEITENSDERRQSWPQDLVWDDQGNIWLLDSQRKVVSCFDEGGTLLLALGGKENDKGIQLKFPTAIGFANSCIFISDPKRHEVLKFSNGGKFLGKLGDRKLNPDFLKNPGGLCQRKKELWIAEKSKQQILCFDSNDKILGRFGSEGKMALNKPINVKAGKENLFVLEKGGIIKIYNPIGEFVSSFDSNIKNPGNFWVDSWGYVWVTDPDQYQIKRFTSTGKLLNEILPPPAPKPWVPTGISIRKDGKVGICDSVNKKILIYQIYEK